MTAVHVDLTMEEREFLVVLLDETLKSTRIEEHRTRAPSYREHITQREEMIKAIRRKLGAATE